MQCEFVRDGKQCRCSALSGSTYCYWHDPRTEPKRKAASAKGGAAVNAKLPRIPLRTMSDILELIEDSIDHIRRLRSPQAISRARCIGYLASIALTALEKSDLERRLSELEGKLAG